MSLWSRDLCKVMSTLRAAILVMSQENLKIFHYFYFDVFENFLIAHIWNIICHAQKIERSCWLADAYYITN